MKRVINFIDNHFAMLTITLGFLEWILIIYLILQYV